MSPAVAVDEESSSSSFDPYSWRNFYFHVDREEATRLLCQSDSDLGTFLIRDSTAPGSYALSVREELSGDQQIRHYLIEPVEADNGKTNVKIADQFFVDIPALLNHFKMRILANVSLVCPLRKAAIKREEWWEARNALGNVGLVPGNYLAQFDEVLMQRDSPESSISSENRLSGVSVLSDTNDDMLNNAHLSETPRMPTLARVILDRRPSVYDTEALRLKKGDFLKVTKLHPSGICEGILNGKKGTFPFTYVEFVGDVDAAATPTPV
ncbi:Cell death abnormality protein 2 [Dirofilaria immitis]|nr:Cell death abnormality protein 2 [Dirofilaria immitis]